MTSYELKIIRKRLGLTQAAFAQRFGAASPRAVSHWERGDRKCPNALDKLFPILYGENRLRLTEERSFERF
jgi:DNA-binding transcriptional regulator YiaG